MRRAQGTITGANFNLDWRLKRDTSGKRDRRGKLLLATVPFILTETVESNIPVLTWHQLAQALVTMTEYAFSTTGHVRVYDDEYCLHECGQERFFLATHAYQAHYAQMFAP